ncbi:hypothetical protein HPULCUR_004200 [Helicostylum pulchrum]|uniref:Uncharacterized protein n=1 Tax=Helicostylum pulchrum TaxID=562976 RepID=A0ABP9XVH8_9FUNG
MLSLRHEPMDDFFGQTTHEYELSSTDSYLPHFTSENQTQSQTIITEEMCIRGIDMQGIDWFKERITRDQYRSQRNKEYESYLSCKSGDDDYTIENRIQAQKTKNVTTNEEYYTFKSSKLDEKCSIGHFQLRNLLWATNKNNIYYVCGDTVRQWSPQRQSSSQVIDLATANRPGSVSLKITSMACAHGILFAGGFKGECVWKVVQDTSSISNQFNTTNECRSIGITNYTDIVKDQRGITLGIVSNNDATIKCINLETAQIEQKFSLPFAANCSSLSPDSKMLCLVGDSTETLIVDADNGKSVVSINEHHDFSFACCWNPDGRTFATGNQDRTTRVYDIRNTSKAMYVLGSNVGAIRSLHYSHDGQYLAAAEPIDFVHIYETNNYESSQVIDMFGDIAGVSFTPEDQSLYIANANDKLG